jgi:catechol 2,3-dioxygenase-like lactoylglutathione lyase family enzyme
MPANATRLCKRHDGGIASALMKAIRLNHVSISAIDVEESARFYEQLFGMERIATYKFAFPSQYLRVGDQQLHLFQRDTQAPTYHHIALDVDDFVEAYERTKELGLHDPKTFFWHIYELPDGSVQMYIRDPGGNLIELNHPDVASLDRSRLVELKPLNDDVPQTGDALRATLYHAGRPGEVAGQA